MTRDSVPGLNCFKIFFVFILSAKMESLEVSIVVHTIERKGQCAEHLTKLFKINHRLHHPVTITGYQIKCLLGPGKIETVCRHLIYI